MFPLLSTGWPQHLYHLHLHCVCPCCHGLQRFNMDDLHARCSFGGCSDATDWLHAWIRHVCYLQTQSKVSGNTHILCVWQSDPCSQVLVLVRTKKKHVVQMFPSENNVGRDYIFTHVCLFVFVFLLAKLHKNYLILILSRHTLSHLTRYYLVIPRYYK